MQENSELHERPTRSFKRVWTLNKKKYRKLFKVWDPLNRRYLDQAKDIQALESHKAVLKASLEHEQKERRNLDSIGRELERLLPDFEHANKEEQRIHLQH